MVQWELDSFFSKFKNLLRTEKDATLTLKAEAGRAFVTLVVDLGHVLSDQEQLQPRGPRNGPARQRRRAKREAARQEKVSAEKVASEHKASAEEVAEDNASGENPCAEEAKESETAEKATEPDDLSKKETEKVEGMLEDLKDEVCPDDLYTSKPKQLKSNRSLQESKSAITSVDYYSLTYEDMSDPD